MPHAHATSRRALRSTTALAASLVVACGVSAVARASDNIWVYGIDPSGPVIWSDEEIAAMDVGAAARGRKPKPAPSPSPSPTWPPAPLPSPLPSLLPATGAGVTVAIVDTGIDLDHPEFSGRVLTGTCFGTTATCPTSSLTGDDNNGHGTHVAGIIAAASNGVGVTGLAPEARLLPVKVLDASGGGTYADVANGIVWAANQNAKIINMSIGGGSSSSVLLTALQTAAPSAAMFAAAGNSGNAYSPAYPAAYATSNGVLGSMIIVGSVNSSNQISSFSQVPGTGGCNGSWCLKDFFLVAPGEYITSTYTGGGYATMSGTSMATPYVSGVAAAVWSAAPYLTVQQLVNVLLQGATDLGAVGVDPIYGRGKVSLAGSLAPLGGTSVATSGATTSSYSGTADVGGSSLSGAMALGLRGSSIAKDVVFFDGFGRDYHVDLTRSMVLPSFSLEQMLLQSGRPGQSFATFGDGYAVSGFVSDPSLSAMQSPDAGLRGDETSVSSVIVQARLTDSAQLTVGYNASTEGVAGQLDLSTSEAFQGLFVSASAQNSPYVALTGASDFAASTVALRGGFSFTAGHAAQTRAENVSGDAYLQPYTLQSATPKRGAESTFAEMTWRLAPWALVGVNGSLTDEEDSLLGSAEAGALGVTSQTETAAIGIAARASLGGGWLASASFSSGSSQATPAANGLVRSFTGIESQAYGFAISKTGVFGETDRLGFAVSRPLHIVSGTAEIVASTGVTETRDIVYSTEVIDLANATPETDFELGYTTEVGEGLSLQANAVFQKDVGGQAGADAVAAFVTLKGEW